MPDRLLLVVLLLWSNLALAGQVTDAAGRAVQVPNQIARVLPAAPPAAVLLAAIASDSMLGWPSPLSDNARALLSPGAGKPPQTPWLTGREDVADKIQALKPNLLFDYGTVSPRYAELAQTQQRTSIATILLDGSLAERPHVFRMLGSILHREGSAEMLATFADVLPALPTTRNSHPRVLYARGTDGPMVAAPGTDVTAVFTCLGWAEEPAPINQLLGLAWLERRDPVALTAMFNAAVYGHAPYPGQLDTILAGVHSLKL